MLPKLRNMPLGSTMDMRALQISQWPGSKTGMGEGMDTSVVIKICTCSIDLLAQPPRHSLAPSPPQQILGKTETQIRQGRIRCFSEDGLPVQMVLSPPVKPAGQRHLNEPRVLTHWALAWHTGIEALHSSISERYHNKCCTENCTECCLKTLSCVL